MDKFSRILKYVNLAMLGWAVFRLVRLVFTVATMEQVRHDPGFWLGIYAVPFITCMIFSCLCWLNYRSVRLRLRDGRPAGLAIPLLNAGWFTLSLIGTVYIILLYSGFIYDWYPRPPLFLLLSRMIISGLDLLYLLANIFHSALCNPRLGPYLKRGPFAVARQTPPPPEN